MAVRFDAATDRLHYLGGTAPPDPRNDITVCMWAYVSVDRNDFSTFIRLWTSASSTTGVFLTTSTGTTLQYATSGGTNTPGFEMPVAGWARIAFTCTGTTSKVYGATATGSIVTQTTTAAGALNPTGLTLGGRDQFDASEWLNGRLAHVRIWSAVLTQAEIVSEWASATPVRTSALWAAYPLSSATDLLDASGNGRHLTAGSTAVTTEGDPPIAVTISGTLAGSLPGLTGDLDGTVTTAGGLAATLPAFTAAMAGEVSTTGTLAGALPELDLAAEGVSGAGGPLDAALPALEFSSAGEVVTAGALAGSLPELAGHLDGGTATVGALAATLPELTGQVVGGVDDGAVLAGELPALDLSAAGSVATSGALAASLPGLTAQAAGGVITAGVLTGALPPLSAALSGDAALPAAGPFTATLPMLVMGSGRDDWPPSVSRPEEVAEFAVGKPEEVHAIAVA